MSSKDALGDRMKAYESAGTHRRAFKGQPLIARLDGKTFHRFCRDMRKPFDHNMGHCMENTMVALVEHFQANVGYTQSDEITLAWLTEPDGSAELPFAGRFQKIESLMAGYCTALFSQQVRLHLSVDKAEALPYFDCRAFVVPNVEEAYHAFLWRQQDAFKNGISMAAHALFAHGKLQGKSGPAMQEMMYAEHGINFNNYPPRFKRGIFAKRFKEMKHLTPAELAKIPEKFRPPGPVERSVLKTFDLWLGKEPGAMDTLFRKDATRA